MCIVQNIHRDRVDSKVPRRKRGSSEYIVLERDEEETRIGELSGKGMGGQYRGFQRLFHKKLSVPFEGRRHEKHL